MRVSWLWRRTGLSSLLMVEPRADGRRALKGKTRAASETISNSSKTFCAMSPAAIKSALVTSARQDILLSDNLTPANPFDFGGGHIMPNDALEPGLVYDVSDEEYDAFACGIASSAVTAVS